MPNVGGRGGARCGRTPFTRTGTILRGSVTDTGPEGHILTGPIHIEGAMPGNVLEVRILSILLSRFQPVTGSLERHSGRRAQGGK